jgi:hypothetical protein
MPSKQSIAHFNKTHDKRKFYQKRGFWVLLCFAFPFALEAALLTFGNALLQLYPPAEQTRIRSSIFYQIQYAPYSKGKEAFHTLFGSPTDFVED